MSHESESTHLAEVLALAQRARGNANFYGHVQGASIAFSALADDLDALAIDMTAPPTGAQHVPTAANCTAGGPGAPISSGLVCQVCTPPASTPEEGNHA